MSQSLRRVKRHKCRTLLKITRLGHPAVDYNSSNNSTLISIGKSLQNRIFRGAPWIRIRALFLRIPFASSTAPTMGTRQVARSFITTTRVEACHKCRTISNNGKKAVVSSKANFNSSSGYLKEDSVESTTYQYNIKHSLMTRHNRRST